MKRSGVKRFGSAALCLCLLVGLALRAGWSGQRAKAAKAAALPVKAEAKTGVIVHSNPRRGFLPPVRYPSQGPPKAAAFSLSIPITAGKFFPAWRVL